MNIVGNHLVVLQAWHSTCTIIHERTTVEPRYNEVLGTMKITFLYQVSHYIRVKNRNIKSWDQQNYLVIRGFCYIWPLYNEVPLYIHVSIVGNHSLRLHAWLLTYRFMHGKNHTTCKCEYCGTSFSHVTNLANHVCIDIEKPYSCGHCGKLFTIKVYRLD